MTEDLQRYIHLSKAENPDERAEAARELKAFLRTESASAALTELLGDSDWRVRRAAVESFLEMRAYNAIPQILQSLYSEDNAGKRNAAIDILTRFGKEIVPHLQPHLASENADVQMFLINIIADLRDDTFLEFITRSLDHADMNIVSSAIIALGKIGHTESLPHLIRFLNSKELWLTFQAIEAAGEMQDPALIPTLVQLHDSEFYKKSVVKALGKFQNAEAYSALTGFLSKTGQIDPDALNALIELYNSPGPTELKQEEQRILRKQFRGNLAEEGIHQLVKLQENSDVQTRKKIIQVLGWTKSPFAYKILVESLKDEELVETAAEALVRGEKEAGALLAQELESNKEEDHIVIVLSILNEMPKLPELPDLTAYLRHDVPEIRYNGFKLLSRSSNAKSGDLLFRGVLDPHGPINEVSREALLARCRDSRTIREQTIEQMRSCVHCDIAVERANSVEFLTLLQGEESFPLLFQALKDEDAIVRQKAVHLMGTGYHDQFQRPLIGALADEDAGVRELAAKALGSYASEEVVDALLSSMRDEVIWVRIATFESLSKIPSERTAAAFLQQLETENPMAKATLLRAFGKFRSPATKDVLLKHLNSDDPQIRKTACESLGRFSDSDIVFHLFTVLQNDADWGVRVAAIEALTNIKPFRLQEALLERLRADQDPFVRKEILKSFEKLGIDFLPQEIYEFLLDRNLTDTAYAFLNTANQRFSKQIQESSKSQPAAIRRILKSLTT